MGETQRKASAAHLSRGDNFVEQREHRSMTPYVVDVNKRGAAVQRTHSPATRRCGTVMAGAQKESGPCVTEARSEVRDSEEARPCRA